MAKINILRAGCFYSDAGASFGNLPQAIWGRFFTTDAKHRIALALNLLLIQDGSKNILVDTGVGFRTSEREDKIFSPELTPFEELLAPFQLTPNDITDVIMTHLHFDHAGGVISYDEDNNDVLTFPNAIYHIQSAEWNIAKNPDVLNSGAYNFAKHLYLLEQQGEINLVEGNYQLTHDIKLTLVGGHSEGMQVIEIKTDEKNYIYAGDIIPSKTFLKVPITSAYDVCRRDTVTAKLWILDKVENSNYTLIFDHSTEEVLYETETN